jgi:hypothetical protein
VGAGGGTNLDQALRADEVNREVERTPAPASIYTTLPYAGPAR